MSRPGDPRKPSKRRRPGADRVVPAWLVIPVAAAAGYLTGEWPGLAFGTAVGFFLWRLRG